MSTPRIFRPNGRQPSEAAIDAYQAANSRLEIERGLPSGFFASGARLLRSKVHLRDLLRDAGLPKAAAERIASGGWPALSPETAASEAAEQIRAAAKLLSR